MNNPQNNDYFDKRFISTCNIIGAYIVDVMHNSLFAKAATFLREGRANSLADAYAANIRSYVHGINRNELYRKLMAQLLEYYRFHTKFREISAQDFEDSIIQQFIPAEFFASFTTNDKESNLYSVIVAVVRQLGELILQPENLHKTIENNKNVAHVKFLQDSMLEMFKLQKDKYSALYAKKVNPQSGGSNRMYEEIIQKLKREVADLTKSNCNLKRDKERLVSMLQQVIGKVSKIEAENMDLNTKVREAELRRAQQETAKFSASVPAYSFAPTTPASALIQSQPQTQPQTPPKVDSRVIELSPEDDESDSEDSFHKKLADQLTKRVEGESSRGLAFDDPGFG